MMRRHFMFVSVLLAWLAAGGGPAVAQTFNSGSTGADGAFNPTSNATIALLPSGVFNYTTVNIPTGVTVTFTKNVANTPVTILATGNVTIAGTIDVAGSPGASGAGQTILAPSGGRGGPGGFDGGSGANGILSNTGGTGLGPGGGGGGTNSGGNGAGAGFLNAGGNGSPSVVGGSAYGASALLPLIGGSGGGGGGATFGVSAPGGGGGGGALLIASSGTITFTGTILARGGGCGSDGVISGCGGGSGGGVRLVATTIAGSGGTINVGGGAGVPGSAGRIRIEGFTNTASINFAGVPSAAVSTASPTTATLTNPPTLSVTSVAGVASPA